MQLQVQQASQKDLHSCWTSRYEVYTAELLILWICHAAALFLLKAVLMQRIVADVERLVLLVASISYLLHYS